ncbi:MAG: choice-of-anchor A family protein, partial [Planctomycetota bacterium]|nr:choice-of-anchor A family protein [Planctomycetota bacterium]
GNTLDVGGSVTESVPFTPSIDFSGYEDYYLRLADAYAGLPHDVNWIDDYGNIRMQLGPGLNVARVSLSTIARSHSFTVDGPPGAILVINAMGNSAEFSSLTWNLSGGVERRDIAINAFEALKGTLAGGNHVTLLAPRAQLTFLQGLLTGNLIVRGLRGVGQLNDGPWRGFYYSPNDGSPGTDVCGSTPNSTTLPAIMACTGSNSFTANDVTLRAIQLPPGEFSIFYYGRAPAYAPLGLGYRCIGGGGYTRLPVLLSGGGGVLTYPLDLHNLPPGPHAAISIGETIYFQAWYRDPQDIYPHNNLSNAIKISFGP